MSSVTMIHFGVFTFSFGFLLHEFLLFLGSRVIAILSLGEVNIYMKRAKKNFHVYVVTEIN